tara:strand:- start:3411 stop:3839 length:429 start_codon:yes stop_codon:yes gene_type:complete
MATRTKSSPMTMYKYLSEKVPSDCHYVLNKFGSYNKARNSNELENQLKHFIRNGGANALQSLAEIHPDRTLLEGGCTNCKVKETKILELTSTKELKDTILNDRNTFYNATGNEEEKMVNKMAINSVVIGGFVLMGVALIIKK